LASAQPRPGEAVIRGMPNQILIDHARVFCRAVRTDAGDAKQWRSIAPIAAKARLGDPAVIAAAVEAGWLEVADGRRVRLTEKGSYLD
jgi:hypothetical protein